MSERVRHGLAFAVVALLWLAPAVVLAVARDAPGALERAATRKSPPSSVVVGTRIAEGLHEVEASLRRADPVTLYSSSDGIVTAVNAAEVGRQVRDGDGLFAVDGITALASTSRVVLYRALSVGDTGPDVAALHEFLLAHRFTTRAVPDLDRYTSATAAAVRRLQARVGAVPNGRFLPAYLVHVGPSFGALASFRLAVGQPVARGGEVGVSVPRVLSVQLQPAAGGPSLDDVAGSPVRLTIGGVTVVVRALPLDRADTQRVGAQLLLRLQPAAAAAGSDLLYTGITLRRSAPRTYGTVPASAVDITSAGNACLYVVAGPGGAPQHVRARPLPTPLAASPEIGVAYVPEGFVGERVLRDAADVAEDRRARCG